MPRAEAKPGDRIGGYVEGTVRQSTRTTLRVYIDGKRSSVPLEDLKRVEIIEHGQPDEGAVITSAQGLPSTIAKVVASALEHGWAINVQVATRETDWHCLTFERAGSRIHGFWDGGLFRESVGGLRNSTGGPRKYGAKELAQIVDTNTNEDARAIVQAIEAARLAKLESA